MKGIIISIEGTDGAGKHTQQQMLLEKLKSQNDILLLRPSDNGLVEFYKKVGFCEFTATNEKNNFALIPKAEYSDLANKNKEDSGTFTAMYYSKENQNFNNLYFPYSMP